MRDIAIVIPTVNREPSARNTLEQTLDNLVSAGGWESDRLHSVSVVDSGGSDDWPNRAMVRFAYTHQPSRDEGPGTIRVYRGDRRLATPNVAEALAIGAGTGAEWVLFCEDDLDFIADFVGSVGRWLDDHAAAGTTTYRFTCAHVAIESRLQQGLDHWWYPVEQSWGTQCFALRSGDAASLAGWLKENPLYRHIDGRMADGAYDLEMHRWARSLGVARFVASVPSFCQHLAPLGRDSTIWKERPWPVEFPSWPGHGWSYVGKKQQQQREVARA